MSVRQHVVFLLVLLVIIIVDLTYSDHPQDRACADFNHAAANAASVGLYNVYVCPKDGIANVACQESFPLKPVKEISQEQATSADYLLYMLIGPNSNMDSFNWWLQFVTHEHQDHYVELVFVGDSCPDDVKHCEDRTWEIQKQYKESYPTQLRTSIVRCHSSDNGYTILSCKLRTGMKRIYEEYPDKKFYFKIDTDSLFFPRRFLSFMSTMMATTDYENIPLYFGAVVESGMDLLLCGRQWETEGNVKKGGLCYGQGGAGYGLNNKAMHAMATVVPNCTTETPFAKSFDGQSPEDVFTALSMYKLFNISIIHCGGFRSSELVSNMLFKQSITFHYIDNNWIRQHGENVKYQYKLPPQ
jgi:hypothetical protein